MSYVIIVDMRGNNGQVCGITEDDEGQWLAQFETPEDAEKAMEGHLLAAFPHIIVDIERRQGYHDV